MKFYWAPLFTDSSIFNENDSSTFLRSVLSGSRNKCLLFTSFYQAHGNRLVYLPLQSN